MSKKTLNKERERILQRISKSEVAINTQLRTMKDNTVEQGLYMGINAVQKNRKLFLIIGAGSLLAFTIARSISKYTSPSEKNKAIEHKKEPSYLKRKTRKAIASLGNKIAADVAQKLYKQQKAKKREVEEISEH